MLLLHRHGLLADAGRRHRRRRCRSGHPHAADEAFALQRLRVLLLRVVLLLLLLLLLLLQVLLLLLEELLLLQVLHLLLLWLWWHRAGRVLQPLLRPVGAVRDVLQTPTLHVWSQS